MNLFATARLAVAPVLETPADLRRQQQQRAAHEARVKNGTSSKVVSSGASSSASSSASTNASNKSRNSAPAVGTKRARPSADALFTASSDEEDEDGAEEHLDDEEEEIVPAPAKRSQQKHRSHRDDSDEADGTAEPAASDSAHPRKKPRNAPEEQTSKRPVKAGVIVTALPSFNVEKKRRDPRFDPMCGEYDATHFHAHYDWMNDEKEKELAEWQAELKSGRRGKRPLTEDERAELQANIQRMKQSLASTKRQKSENSLMQEWKRTERAAQKDGKKPFFLKKSEQKKLALASRYIDLKEKKGALQKAIEKRMHKVKNLDHKYMPRDGRE